MPSRRMARASVRVLLKRSIENVKFKRTGLRFGNYLSPDRLAGRVDGLAVTGDEIVPSRQWQTSGAQFIGATIGQPVELLQLGTRQPYTIRDMKLAVAVVTALGLLDIKQFAGNIGHIYLAIVLVFGL